MIRYAYTLATVDLDQLQTEITALALPGLLGICSSDSTVEALFSSALTNTQKTTLNAAMSAHTPDPAGPTKRARVAAKAMLDNDHTGAATLLIRAVMLAIVDGLNQLRQNPTTVFPALTKAQIVTAIKNHLDDGSSD